jgi:hypothetical protein
VDVWEEVNVEMVIVHITGVDIIVNSQIYDSKWYRIEDISLNHKLRDLNSHELIATGNGGVGRKQIINFKYFDQTQSAPSMRFGEYSAFGGASSMMEGVVHGE